MSYVSPNYKTKKALHEGLTAGGEIMPTTKPIGFLATVEAHHQALSKVSFASAAEAETWARSQIPDLPHSGWRIRICEILFQLEG